MISFAGFCQSETENERPKILKPLPSSKASMGLLVDLVALTTETVLSLIFLIVAWPFGVLLAFWRAINKPRTPRTFRNILITGASSGIGRGLAERYASLALETNQTIQLHLVGRDTARLSEVAESCRSDPAVSVTTHPVDVTDATAMSELLTRLDDQHPLDLVIANAGVSAGTASDGAVDCWSTGMQQLNAINWQGTLNTILPLIERFRQRKLGSFVIMSSVASTFVMPASTSYNVTKVAQLFFGIGLRSELAADNVGVSTIVPGFVSTPLTDKNRFKMPGMISTEAAVQIMVNGIARNESLIATHPFVYFLCRAVACLPHATFSVIVNRFFPSKKASRMYRR